jgi:hypothetical protein
MKHAQMKTADDVIVSDPEEEMRRTKEAVRRILSVPKSAVTPAPTRARRKPKRDKR